MSETGYIIVKVGAGFGGATMEFPMLHLGVFTSAGAAMDKVKLLMSRPENALYRFDFTPVKINS